MGHQLTITINHDRRPVSTRNPSARSGGCGTELTAAWRPSYLDAHPAAMGRKQPAGCLSQRFFRERHCRSQRDGHRPVSIPVGAYERNIERDIQQTIQLPDIRWLLAQAPERFAEYNRVEVLRGSGAGETPERAFGRSQPVPAQSRHLDQNQRFYPCPNGCWRGTGKRDTHFEAVEKSERARFPVVLSGALGHPRSLGETIAGPLILQPSADAIAASHDGLRLSPRLISGSQNRRSGQHQQHYFG